MNPTPELRPLLEALNREGFPAGLAELARLRQVFRLAPNWGGEAAPRLKSVLRAILLKDADQADRFDRICDHWLAAFEPALQRRPETQREAARLPEADTSRPIPETRPRRHRLRRFASLLVLLLLLPYPAGFQQPMEPPPPARTADKLQEKTQDPTQPQTLADLRKATFPSRKPQLTVSPPQPRFRAWQELTLGLLALAATGILWREARRRRWLPEPEPLPSRQGPPRIFLTREVPEEVMLDPDEQQTLVWGIDRYAALDPTRRLDIPATVRATAHAAGIPTVVFQTARHQREVWLWLDEAAEDPGLARLAEEMAALLPRHGLRLERAGFWGVPDRLRGADGRSFAPREIEERRGTARVAILTDGRHLARGFRVDDQRARLTALLRLLSHWPELWFVDSSRGATGLPEILFPHGIPCVAPAGLVQCLSGSSRGKRRRHESDPDAEIWAAACALAPGTVDAGLAWKLHRALRLRAGPWALDAMRREAQGPGDRLQWPRERRAQMVNGLAVMEPAGTGTLLNQVLDFWQHEYQDEVDRRTEAGGDAWSDSPAARHIRMELALLRLWREPEAAIPNLYRLYQGALVEPIRRQLAALAPSEPWPGKVDQIRLPWAWAERTGPERQMLYDMNFAEPQPGRMELRQPGRLWLGLSLGIGLAALLLALRSPWDTPGGPPVLEHEAGKPERLAEGLADIGGGRWRIILVTPDWRAETEAPAGAAVTVEWPEDQHHCREDQAGREIWHGACLNPTRQQAVAQSLALLDGPAEAAEALVLALLQSGSADLVGTGTLDPPEAVDAVLHDADATPGEIHLLRVSVSPSSLGPKAPSPLGERAGERGLPGLAGLADLPHMAWLQAADWQSLAEGLRFDGERTAAQAWPSAKTLAGDPAQVRLLGLGETCRPAPYTDANGLDFVRLCPGRFLMGSPEDEKDRYNDESPQHEVSVSAFDLGRTEVTHAQYRKFKPEHPENGDRPVANVDWNEAKAYCEHYGDRLPTEAEWEYAARAGSSGRWSFGDDESKLGEYAWYSSNSDRQTHPVGQKQPNAWGLYDMHGNVYEWVSDWYVDHYGAKAETDPAGPAKGDYRVLRGGAFSDEPGFLRSASRGRFLPVFRYEFIGFRCARGPRRQP